MRGGKEKTAQVEKLGKSEKSKWRAQHSGGRDCLGERLQERTAMKRRVNSCLACVASWVRRQCAGGQGGQSVTEALTNTGSDSGPG